jgi:hypothetical protein
VTRIARLIIRICSTFPKRELEQIIAGLRDVLKDRDREVESKDKHEKQQGKPLPPVT